MEKILTTLLLAIVTLTLAKSTSKPSDLNCQSCNAVNSRLCCKEKKICCIPRSQSSHDSTLNNTFFSCNQSLCLRDSDCASKKCQINRPKFCIPKKVLQYLENMATPSSAGEEEGGNEETSQDENQEETGEETQGDETQGDETQGDKTQGDETQGDDGEGPGDEETAGDEAPGDDEAAGEEAPGDEETAGDEAPGDDEAAGDAAPGDEETAGDEAPGDDEAAGEQADTGDEAPGDDEAAGEQADTGDEEASPEAGDEPGQDETERRKRHLIIKQYISISTCTEDSECGTESVCKEHDIGCCSGN